MFITSPPPFAAHLTQLELFAMAILGLTLGHVAFDAHCWRDAPSPGRDRRGGGAVSARERGYGPGRHPEEDRSGGDGGRGEMESLDPCCAS